VLNVRDPVILTEVTPEGEIAWELQILCNNNTCYWVQRVDRFYEKPVIEVNDHALTLSEGDLWLNVSVWNGFKQDVSSPATLRLLADGQEIYEETFEFLPHWQENSFQFSVTNIPSNSKLIEIVVENSDGIEGRLPLYEEMIEGSIWDLALPLALGSAIVAIPVVIWYTKYRRPTTHSE
ncbi:MAG: hypothetical protein ACFE8Z_05285, partial [Candidatus Hermodarchaeota archaeon]